MFTYTYRIHCLGDNWRWSDQLRSVRGQERVQREGLGQGAGIQSRGHRPTEEDDKDRYFHFEPSCGSIPLVREVGLLQHGPSSRLSTSRSADKAVLVPSILQRDTVIVVLSYFAHYDELQTKYVIFLKVKHTEQKAIYVLFVTYPSYITIFKAES